jgi:GNAT superfamily N-acetyltransferase
VPILIWEPYRSSLAPDVVRLWNKALGEQFPMTLRLFRQNTEGAPSYRADDSTVVVADGQVISYILTKRFREQDTLLQSEGATGWIEALVVDPAWQRQGVGRDLLAWAVYKLRSEGAQKILLGGGVRHFLPGVPAGPGSAQDYFARAGFVATSTVYDLRGSLRGFTAPPSASTAVAAAGGSVTPCRPDDVLDLSAFLLAEFPGRWRFDTQCFLSQGGAPQDIMILRQGTRVTGFAHIYHRRSAYLGSPIAWHRLLGRAYGGLGPIGVAKEVRGKGLGLALLQLSLQRLAGLGVADAVIDWTTLTGFYGHAGFTPWKAYVHMQC